MLHRCLTELVQFFDFRPFNRYEFRRFLAVQPQLLLCYDAKRAENAAEAKQRDRENKIRFFVLQNFGGLRTDVFSGGDQHEYLDALAEMTKLPKTDLRNIIENSDSEGECAERTIESYISNRKNGGH